MNTIENPTYTKVIKKGCTVHLAQGDDVLPDLSLPVGVNDWLIRPSMDALLVKDWDIAAGPERTYDHFVIRQGGRDIGRVRVSPQTIRENTTWRLSRALCVPERMPAPAEA